MTAPYILLTNDDGINAPGLLALASSLRSIGDVAIMAPEHNWSASGHSKTMHKPLRAWGAQLADGSAAFATSGSPSDCVALALLGLVERKPDLVVSGINIGANVGHDLTYSGTVSAAMEGLIGGISSIAVSLDSYEATEFSTAARFAAHLADRVLKAELEQPMLLNVNVPYVQIPDIRGVLITRLGHRLYRDALVRRTDPRGRSYYWIGGDPPDGVIEEGTDIGALAHNCISVTPIRLDLTAYSQVKELESWDLRFPA